MDNETNVMLDKVKLALRITTDDFNGELQDLIDACLLDLGIAGVTEDDTTNKLIIRAIITFCKMNFGDVNGIEMTDRLKASYDEQKAQLSMATGYTTWQ